MKVARIHLKPDGLGWYTMQIADEQSAQTIFAAIRAEGGVVHPDFYIPAETIHHVTILSLATPSELLHHFPQAAQKPN